MPMMREEKVEEIAYMSEVDFYLSSRDGGDVWWPWRMQPVHEATPRYVDACEKYLVDSSFNREDITNQDALDKAAEFRAYGVLLEDVYLDVDATINRLLEGRELVDSHPFGGEVYHPLQQPYERCWKEIGEPEKVALGGLKDATSAEKVRAAKRFRELVGDDVVVHGLGWGPSDKLARAVVDQPELVDSIDASTPIYRARHMDILPGEGNLAVRNAHTLGYLLESARKMSRKVMKETPQSELGEYV